MTTSYVVRAMELGIDQKGLPRGLFFYDGGCGVCKYTVSIVAKYDKYDHLRFRPLQTSFTSNGTGSDTTTSDTTTTNNNNNSNNSNTIDDTDVQMKELYLELGIKPFDLSTAVLLEGTNNHIYMKSDAILYLLKHMGFPFTIIGPLLLLLIPKFIRDFGYMIFAKYRSTIWIYMKRITGLNDTSLYIYKSKIILPQKYIDNPTLIPMSWGLHNNNNNKRIQIEGTTTTTKNNTPTLSFDMKKES
jgi:predicted DCC family thiol-disulfide oxidoreductase YuxK